MELNVSVSPFKAYSFVSLHVACLWQKNWSINFDRWRLRFVPSFCHTKKGYILTLFFRKLAKKLICLSRSSTFCTFNEMKSSCMCFEILSYQKSINSFSILVRSIPGIFRLLGILSLIFLIFGLDSLMSACLWRGLWQSFDQLNLIFQG